MVRVLLVPGFGDSGPGHWQRIWAEKFPFAERVDLGDWEHPRAMPWAERLEAAAGRCGEPPVVVAHSLGSIAVAWVAARGRERLRAALLVSPPDMSRPDLPPEVRAFGASPLGPLGFEAVVASSSNDPYCDPAEARDLAARWRARFVDLGSSGHVNVASGHGPWPEGERLLLDILARTGGTQKLEGR